MADGGVPDGRATSLLLGARSVMQGVPQGASYGTVLRYNDDLTWPSLRLKGDPESGEFAGDLTGRHMALFRTAKRRGTAVVENTCCGRSMAIGGLLIIPTLAGPGSHPN